MKTVPRPLAETADAPITETLSSLDNAEPDEAARIAEVWESVDRRYRLAPAPLGSGGSAYVWRAYDRELEREVALKVLRPERKDPRARLRFGREVKLAQAVSSPHLVKVFDIGQRGDFTFLTMELAEGGSLRDRLRRGPLSIDECAQIAEGLLRALDALHRAGLVHRDVKPGNVLFGKDGRVILGDLGLVREMPPGGTGVTQHGLLLGTPDYLAPEQFRAEPASPAADLYAFGMVLFEGLTGGLPFAGEKTGQLARRLASPAPRVGSLRPDAPRWLSGLVDLLLELDPARRPPTAAAALRALEARSLPLRRATWLAVGGLATVAATAVALVVWLTAGSSVPFDHFTVVDNRLAGSIVRGYSADGKLLWERKHPQEALGRHLVLARRGSAKEPVLAILAPLKSPSPKPPFVLETWSVSDGRTLSRWDVSRMTDIDLLDWFDTDDFADVFHAGTLATVDFDHDGTDELVVTALHHPEWPAAALLVEPEKQRARLLFVAGGHMRLMGKADLDGDGFEDLLFSGLDSNLGRFAFLAAVRSGPWLTESADTGFMRYAVGSPGLPNLSRFPFWFRLLPPHFGEEFELQVDSLHRILALKSTRGADISLTFDGKMWSAAHDQPELTKEALSLTEKARRLDDENDPKGALERFAEARAVAEASGDSYLSECVGRLEAELFARRGQFRAAHSRFEALSQTSKYRPSLGFRAAMAFHVGGALDRAIHWYRFALRPMANDQVGTSRQFVLGGLLLALGELGEWARARAETERFRFEQSETYQRYAEWRSGLAPVVTYEQPRWLGTDEEIYLDLELKLAARRPLNGLLEQVEFQIQKASLTRGHLHALRGHLLSQLGRHGEAAAELETGLAIMARVARKDPFARFFLPIARERADQARAAMAGAN